jgi:hypothetical protein
MISLQTYQINTTLAVRVRGTGGPRQVPTTGGAPIYERKLHVAFVIDTSGSMDGERLQSVKRTLQAARDVFQAEDRVTLVTFGNDARVITSNHPLDEEGKTSFYAMVDALQTTGSTNLSAGMESAAALGHTYDSVILLTDGEVNRGITTNAGLCSLATGLYRGIPLNLLGYGSDHNRVLLRNLALQSRGSYTYVDREDTLPVTVGDILGGLRYETARGATLQIRGGGDWTCLEAGASAENPNIYRIGGIVADRDYWVIFKAENLSTSETEVILTAEDLPGAVSSSEITLEDTMEVREQIFRCRVASALAEASNALESHQRTDNPEQILRDLRQEILDAPEELRNRVLMIRMVAQIDEVLELIENTYHESHFQDRFGFRMQNNVDVLARLSSGAACLSNQRGVLSQMPNDIIGLDAESQDYDQDPTLSPRAENPRNISSAFFSSPCQRTVSSNVQREYYSMTE